MPELRLEPRERQRPPGNAVNFSIVCVLALIQIPNVTAVTIILYVSSTVISSNMALLFKEKNCIINIACYKSWNVFELGSLLCVCDMDLFIHSHEYHVA